MTELDTRFLRATPAHALALAEFVQIASEGLGLHLWKTLAGGHDPWSVGRARLSRDTGGLSYRNAVIVELARQPVAGMISYPLGDHAEPIPDDEPAALVPLHNLTNLALRTWYVHALAVSPQHTGCGFGSALLAEAERLAARAGKSGMSLAVTDTNAGARRLYKRCGYRETARRKMVKDGWEHPGIDWVLMTKRLQPH
jgi:ribosomal protein S18 acetylase RimI-like enzyme